MDRHLHRSRVVYYPNDAKYVTRRESVPYSQEWFVIETDSWPLMISEKRLGVDSDEIFGVRSTGHSAECGEAGWGEGPCISRMARYKATAIGRESSTKAW